MSQAARAGIVLVILLPAILCAATPPPTKLQVQTLDTADKPLEGVDVYLIRENFPDANEDHADAQRFGPIKSDASGLAMFDVPRPATQPKWTRTSIFARVPGKQLGVAIADEADQPMKVVLAAAAPLKGKVTVPAGFNMRDVQVSLLCMMVKHGTADMASIYPAKTTWPELFHYAVADDGSFTIPEAPLQGAAYVAANTRGLGEAQFMAAADATQDQTELRCRKEGIIEGRVTAEGDDAPPAAAVANVLVVATPDHRSGLVVTHPYTASTDAAGKFRIDGLPEATYTLGAQPRQAIPDWVMPNRENVLVKPGETVGDVTLKLERGALVIGQVTDSLSGKGVKDVSVTALFPAQDNAQAIGYSSTDDEGRYALRLPVGASKLYFSGLPEGYTDPPQKEAERTVTVAKGETDKEGPAWVLTKQSTQAAAAVPSGTAMLRGRVVDQAGKPVQGAHIADDRIERWGGDDMPVQDPKAATTDADGRFEFKAAAGIKHRLTVSDVQWQHATTPQFMPKKDETFTHADIVVRERPVVGTITGMVVDPDGKPIEGVEVGFSSPLRTDANGKFSMQIRGESKPVMINFRKTGYRMRNWNDIPPDAKDVRFVLPPGNQPDYVEGRPQPPTPKQAIGKPAPKLDVETWIHLPAAAAGKAPTLGASGRKMFVLFDWNCDEPAAVKKRIALLQAEAAKANADAIVIFGPQSHETGVRAMLGTDKPNVSIGIDRYDPASKYDISGATMATWGFGNMPHAFVVDEKGIVAREQRGVAKLAGVAK